MTKAILALDRLLVMFFLFPGSNQIAYSQARLDNDQTAIIPGPTNCQMPHSGGMKIGQIPASCPYPPELYTDRCIGPSGRLWI